jgi:hypothetical protein
VQSCELNLISIVQSYAIIVFFNTLVNNLGIEKQKKQNNLIAMVQ